MTDETTPRHRYGLSKSDAGWHIRDQDDKVYALGDLEAGGPHRLRLVQDLVGVANRRIGRFDPLLNVTDAVDAAFVALKREYPALLEAGVLQPLVDLTAALQDCGAGAQALLLTKRGAFDGSYRSHDEMPLDADGQVIPRNGRPTRLYRYQIEALAVVAYEALLTGHDAEGAQIVLATTLKQERIQLPSAKKPEDLKPLKASTVVDWKKNLDDLDNPAAARKYSVELCRTACAEDLEKCVDKQVACDFARRLLVKMRLHQPDPVTVAWD